MVLNAKLRLSVEEYTVLQQMARGEGKDIQTLLSQRVQDLVDDEIEKYLGNPHKDAGDTDEKRLTYREKNGKWGIKGVDWKDIPRNLYGTLCKLKDYEDTGLSPDEIERMMEEVDGE